MIKTKSFLCVYDSANIAHILDFKMGGEFNCVVCYCGDVLDPYKNAIAIQYSEYIICNKCISAIPNLYKTTYSNKRRNKYIKYAYFLNRNRF